jgi:UDP-N-acetyl-alpha-D-quinovosamine dehydrogenase
MLLVTGATGFIGRAVCDALRERHMPFRAAIRRPAARGQLPPGGEICDVGEIDGTTDWGRALAGVGAVLHLAGRAHVFGRAADEEAEFLRVNVEGTEQLARAAAAAEVRHFIFLSSAKVNGEHSNGRALLESDPPRPVGPYAVSKWQAEERVRRAGAETGLSYTIIRTPLVYGPGVSANFLSLLRLVDRGVPLPFGRATNARSLIYVRNLADALLHCVEHPAAGGETFFVKDGPDLSVAELVRQLGAALDRPVRLVAVPPTLLTGAARLFGRGDAATRLFGSLVVDAHQIRKRTGWTPPYSIDEGLTATASWYRANGVRS